MDILPLSSTGLGIRRDHRLVAGDRGNDIYFLQGIQAGWSVDGSVPGMGELRQRVELCDLAVEHSLTS